jgi:hypothetical protein
MGERRQLRGERTHMGVFKAIGEGFRITLAKTRMAGGLWLANLLFAAAVLAPLALVLERDFGHSELGRSLGTFNFIWLGDLLFKYRSVMSAAAGWLLASLALYLLLSVFLNGGIVGGILDKRGRPTLQAFFSDCGTYAYRFLRLFLLQLVFDLLTVVGFVGLLQALFRPAIETVGTEITVFILSNLPWLFALLVLTIVHAAFDYARILTVAGNEPRVLAALGAAGRFFGRRFFGAWSLYLTVGIFVAAGAALYRILGPFLSGPGFAAIAATFLWSQAFILFRIGTKILFFSAQAEYYRTNRMSEDE